MANASMIKKSCCLSSGANLVFPFQLVFWIGMRQVIVANGRARVGCDDLGHVIGLFLIIKGKSGRIGESSARFRLTYLSNLDLFYNDFTTSEIPNQFHRLPNLTHLDLSNSGFMGPFPSTLSNLTELVEACEDLA